MSLSKDDIQAIKDAFEPRFQSLEGRFDSVDGSFGIIEEQLSTLATQEEVKARFREQTEQIHRAFKDSAELVLHTHPTKEEYEELKNRVKELGDILEAFKKPIRSNNS